MPVLEDGLSDSENRSDDEQSSPTKTKSNGRHQSTQSDFIFDSNHSSLITASHKQQFAKSSPTNGVEPQSKSFYIRPPPPSSLVQPVIPSPVQTNESKPSAEDASTTAAGKLSDSEQESLFSLGTYMR